MLRASLTTTLSRIFALLGNIGLLIWVLSWQLSLSPHPHINYLAMASVWAIPLLLALPGIIRGNPYTHAWANFILMFYFLHALTLIYIDGGERWLASIELLITTLAFISNIIYARVRGQQLGLKLDRLSKVEKEEKQRFESEQ